MLDLDVLLEGAREVAVAGHVRPDGDCAGSCLAVYNYIRTYHPGISVTVYLEPIPNKFRFLAGAEAIESSCEKDRAHDVFFALDCGDAERLGDAAKYFHAAKRTVCIDHHVSNDSFADINYIFPDASSTSELVYGLIGEEKVTKDIAECVYLGIVHDTGVFQYSCTSARTMEIAGRLMDKGIDFSRIVDDTFYTKTYEQNLILGKALLKSERFCGGKVIFSVITRQEMEECGALPRHLDGIVNQLRITRGVEMAVFLYQTDENGYKASIRTNGVVNAAKLSRAFGGGGHERAAGFSAEGRPEEIIRRILDAAGMPDESRG